jgi:hypothetical protein
VKKYVLAIMAVIMLVLTGCSSKYNEDEIIGKRSDEIVNTYGKFDIVLGIDVPDEKGIYRNCSCGYTIKEPHKGFFGTSEEVLFYIKFDETGVATGCREDVRPGG